jgi:HAD superfamily hydrolase (TIGR01549 family)
MHTAHRPLPRPQGLLLDYGGTLVNDAPADLRAGHAWLLEQASYRPAGVTLDDVIARAAHIAREVAARRDAVQVEMPWPSLARLTYDFFGIRFDRQTAALELGFWQAAVRTTPLPGARDALQQLHGLGLPMGVVSNTSVSAAVIRFELARHGLADHLAFILVSSEYSVRKPNVLLFEMGARRLGVAANDVWFAGDRLDNDVAGAQSAGMTAVWFNPAAAVDPDARADASVADWAAFVRLAEACTMRPPHTGS